MVVVVRPQLVGERTKLGIAFCTNMEGAEATGLEGVVVDVPDADRSADRPAGACSIVATLF
jgi:hypothetical protein